MKILWLTTAAFISTTARRYWLSTVILLLASAAGLTAFLQAHGFLPNSGYAGRYQLDRAALFSGMSLMLGVGAMGSGVAWSWVEHRIHQARVDDSRSHRIRFNQFLHDLDHLLKNPLCAVLMGLSGIRREIECTPEQAAILDSVVDQAISMEKIVKELRGLGELYEANHIDRAPVNLVAILEDATSLVTSIPENLGRDVSLNIPWLLPDIWAHQDWLITVFYNLLDNALKYSMATDKVEIRATEEIQVAVVEITDTGRGIPPEDLELIFGIAHRGQNARDRSGSGMGLPLAKRIVDLHGGQISVRSRLGKGTIVTIRLPLAQEAK